MKPTNIVSFHEIFTHARSYGQSGVPYTALVAWVHDTSHRLGKKVSLKAASATVDAAITAYGRAVSIDTSPGVKVVHTFTNSPV